jgi:hypothetical protein
MISNLQVLERPRLSEDDMEVVNKLRAGKQDVRYMDPSQYWGFDIFNEEKDEPCLEALVI